MKKIFIILSVLSLFVGCASKPKNEQKEQSSYALMKEKIINTVYSSNISQNDWDSLWQNVYSYERMQEHNVEPIETWFNSKINRSDLAIKINNTSNKTIHLRLIFNHGSTYESYFKDKKLDSETEEYYMLISKNKNNLHYTRCFDIVLDAKESKTFIIPDSILLKENNFTIYDLDQRKYVYILIDGESPIDYFRYTLLEEIFKTHDIEYNISSNSIKFIEQLDFQKEKISFIKRVEF